MRQDGAAPKKVCKRHIKPMKDGVIADFEAAEKMLTHFIRKAHGAGKMLSDFDLLRRISFD